MTEDDNSSSSGEKVLNANFAKLRDRWNAAIGSPSIETINSYRESVATLASIDKYRRFLPPISTWLLTPIPIFVKNIPRIVAESRNRAGKPQSSERLLLSCLATAEIILREIESKLDKIDIFLTLLDMFFELISADNNRRESMQDKDHPARIITEMTDDIRISLIACLRALIIAIDPDVLREQLRQSYSSNENSSSSGERFKYRLGHLINVAMTLLRGGRDDNSPNQNAEIRLRACELAFIVFARMVENDRKTTVDSENHHHHHYRNIDEINFRTEIFAFRSINEAGEVRISCEIAQIAAFCIPRIASTIGGLLKRCSGGDYYLLPQSLIIVSLKLLNLVLFLCFESFDHYHHQQTINEHPHLRPESSKSEIMRIEFTTEWFDQTTERLEPILSRIFDILIAHPQSCVRRTLLEFARTLLSINSTKFILKFVKTLLQVPLAYVDEFVDEEDEDSYDFDRFGAQISAKFDSITQFDLDNVLHTELFALITEIPLAFRNIELEARLEAAPGSGTFSRIIISRDSLPALFRKLSGYVRMLGTNGFERFVRIEQHRFELFRTLINVAEMDFDHSPPIITDDDDDKDEDGGDNFDLIQRSSTSDQHLIALHLDSELKLLTDRRLREAYQSSIACIARTAATTGSWQIILDHMIELLRESRFEPSVMLVLNHMLLEAANAKNQSLNESYLVVEIYELYRENLSISTLAQQVEKNENVIRKQGIKNVDKNLAIKKAGESLDTIVRVVRENDNRELREISSINRDRNRALLRHRLLLQGIAFCYTLTSAQNSCKYFGKNNFFRKSFCHFLEALANDFDRRLAIAAKRLLRYIADCFRGDSSIESDDRQKKSNYQIIATMISENMDYIYAEFAVQLDTGVLLQQQQQQVFFLSSDRVDHQISLRTIQVALQTIFRILSQTLIFQANENENSRYNELRESKLDYFHRLIDQILCAIKCYSVRPGGQKCSANLRRLLAVLLAYCELLETIYGDNSAEPKRRIESNDPREEEQVSPAKSAIDKIEQYIAAYHKNLNMDNDEDLNDPDLEVINNDDDENTEIPNEEIDPNAGILDSPIIKSRVGDILYHCSLILSDADIEIRLATLQIASKSMRLLRRYEDILLPYVHRLWDPLVARFSAESDHPLILSRAYDCLLCAAEFSGDFLQSRTRSTILPRLIAFLRTRLDARIAYFISHHHRCNTIRSVESFAERRLLETIGQLAIDLRLRSRSIWPIIAMLVSYLIVRPIPRDLREAAFRSAIELARHDCASVRFYAHRVTCQIYYHRNKIATNNNQLRNDEDENCILFSANQSFEKNCSTCSRRSTLYDDCIRRCADTQILLAPQNCVEFRDLISFLNNNNNNV